MNIALVCNEYPPSLAGGIGTWTQSFARGLVRKGHNVWVVGIYSGAKIGQEKDLGVSICRIPASKIPKGRAFIDRIAVQKKLAKIHQTNEIDIVEIPDYQGYGAFYAGFAPSVVRLHSLPKRWSDPVYAKKHKTSWFEKTTFTKADYLIAVSYWAEKITKKRFPLLKNISTVYYTISEVFLQSNPEEVLSQREEIVIFAGTLADHKGIWELGKAWPIVKRKFPNARLIIAGKDWKSNSRKQSNQEIFQKKLSCLDADFLGPITQEELSKYYKRATVACFPSKNETLGLVAAEALACGTPTIYTKNGPGPEIGGGGERATLIDPEDPQDIARAICEVLSDPIPFYYKAMNASKWVKDHFSADVTISQSEQLYSSLSCQR